MKKLLAILIFFSLHGLAQKTNSNSDVLTVDQQLDKRNHNQYLAIKNKANYLLIDDNKLKNRRKIYEGDLFCFRDKTGQYYQENIESISDSSFTISSYSMIDRHFSYYKFKPQDVTIYYIHPLHKINFKMPVTLIIAGMASIAYDWINFKIPPTQNKNTLIGLPIVYVGGLLIQNRDLYFNKKPINSNRPLKILKAF